MACFQRLGGGSEAFFFSPLLLLVVLALAKPVSKGPEKGELIPQQGNWKINRPSGKGNPLFLPSEEKMHRRKGEVWTLWTQGCFQQDSCKTQGGQIKSNKSGSFPSLPSLPPGSQRKPTPSGLRWGSPTFQAWLGWRRSLPAGWPHGQREGRELRRCSLRARRDLLRTAGGSGQAFPPAPWRRLLPSGEGAGAACLAQASRRPLLCKRKAKRRVRSPRPGRRQPLDSPRQSWRGGGGGRRPTGCREFESYRGSFGDGGSPFLLSSPSIWFYTFGSSHLSTVFPLQL